MGGFLYVGDYIIPYSYLISFMGAILYGIVSILNINPSEIVANKTISIIIYIVIGICGYISLFDWLNIDDPILTPILLPPNSKKLKKQT
jgi:uncharacterized membrane protein YuzA (DUF378 family)